MPTEDRLYPSDLTREQFELIRPLLESARKKTKPREVDLFYVFNAVLYLLKTGCQWRMLPKEYPKWRTVHEYFTIWRRPRLDQEQSLLEQVLKKIGWRGPMSTGAERADQLFNHRRTKCEEHRFG